MSRRETYPQTVAIALEILTISPEKAQVLVSPYTARQVQHAADMARAHAKSNFPGYFRTILQENAKCPEKLDTHAHVAKRQPTAKERRAAALEEEVKKRISDLEARTVAALATPREIDQARKDLEWWKGNWRAFKQRQTAGCVPPASDPAPHVTL